MILNVMLERSEVFFEHVSPGYFLAYLFSGSVLCPLFFLLPLAARHFCKEMQQAERFNRTPELYLAACLSQKAEIS